LQENQKKNCRGQPGCRFVQCAADGKFSAKQCDESTGYCWCVDVIKGTRTSRSVPPYHVAALRCQADREEGETCGWVYGHKSVGQCVKGLECKCVGFCSDPLISDVAKICVRKAENSATSIKKFGIPKKSAAPKRTVCTDFPLWKSRSGRVCLDYELSKWCNSDGSYGPGWSKIFFGSFKHWSDDKGVDATQACCVCGGGSKSMVSSSLKNKKVKIIPTLPKSPINPHSISVTAGSEIDCVDFQWRSITGTTCAQYQMLFLCTVDGKYGPGWQESWGTFAKWANQNVDATRACCACGGGYSLVKSSHTHMHNTHIHTTHIHPTHDSLQNVVKKEQSEVYPVTKKLSQKQNNSHTKNDSNVIHVDIMLHNKQSPLTARSLKKIFSKIMNLQSNEMKVFIEPKKIISGNSTQHIQLYLKNANTISSARRPETKSAFNDNSLLQSFIEAGFSVSNVVINSPAWIDRKKKNWQHNRGRNRRIDYQLNPLH